MATENSGKENRFEIVNLPGNSIKLKTIAIVAIPKPATFFSARLTT
jgi:hypothetical protein